jgi:hypothetical protein
MVESTVNVVTTIRPGDVPVPAEYAALGAKSGYAPCPADELRMLIDGPEGEGKTTFAASVPDNIILDFERGADGIVAPRSVRIHIKGYDHYVHVTDKLLADAKAGKRPFSRITFDTTDRWVTMIATQIAHEKMVEDIVEYGQEGHGWQLLRNRCWSRVQELEEAGYAWTMVGHLTEKTVTDPVTKKDITVPRLSVFPTLKNPLVQSVEFHGTVFCITTEEPDMETVKLPSGQSISRPKATNKKITTYYFDCSSTSGKQGKKRGVPTMKARIELPLVNGWDVFIEEYRKAIGKEQK